MKLKTKLIATIVSICAAIAVMGVGVWAATQNFTVSVTTTANLKLYNLAGTITYTGSATQVGGANQAGLTDAESTIFDSTAASTTWKSTIDATGYNVPKALDKTNGIIDLNTTSATVTYTFVYTPADANAVGDVKVTINDSATDLVNGTTVQGATIEIAYTINGTAGKTATIAASQTIEVVCTLTYSNASGLSVDMDGNWVFGVTFAAAAPTPAPEG